MLRIAKFGVGIVRKARIPSKSGVGQLLMPNSCRTYRRNIRSSESVTFKANDLSCEIEEDEEEFDCDVPKWIVTEILTHIVGIIQSQGKKINWDNVIVESVKATKVHNLDREMVKAHIVRACEMEKLYPALTSYFEYLIKNKELCAGMLYLICDAVNKNQAELSKCVDIINELRKKLLPEQGIALTLCLSVLSRNSKYRSLLTNKNSDIMIPELHDEGVAYYFNNNDVDSAFKWLSSVRADKVVGNFSHFINYFETCADMREIPVSRLVTFFDVLSKETVYFSNDCNEYIERITKLMSKFNKLDKSYMWYCKPSEIGECCNFCSGKLNKVDISQEEIDVLKVEIEKNVIYGQNINIKSTSGEWKSFLQYINKKSYDIVLDGLNVWFAYQKDPQFFEDLLKTFEEKELTPLTVARKHFVSSSAYGMIQKKYPFFLAADLSHDDVFVIYAALNRGKNCYLMTNDQMGFAKTSLGSPDLEEMFVRWQASHQCFATRRGIAFPHGLLLGFQKSPSENEEEFRYHLVMKDSHYRKIYCISRLKRQ